MDNKLDKWLRHITIIEEDLTYLVWHKSVYVEVVGIVERNTAINRPNLIWDWLSRNWVSASLMGIRRQTDKHPDAVSLANLIQDVSQNAVLASREHHASFYRPEMRALAAQTFDRLAGEGNDHYPPENATKDMEQLWALGERVREYIDRRLAHFDKAKQVRIGTFKDIYEVVDGIELLFQKYALLLTAQHVEVLPIPQYEWKDILRVPWISPPP